MRKKIPELRRALQGRFGSHHRFLVGRILAHLDYLDEAIEECGHQIKELLLPFAQVVERLKTIPGVQQRTAEVIVSEIGVDMSGFPPRAIWRAGAGCARATTRVRVRERAARLAKATSG
jgi:transposase